MSLKNIIEVSNNVREAMFSLQESRNAFLEEPTIANAEAFDKANRTLNSAVETAKYLFENLDGETDEILIALIGETTTTLQRALSIAERVNVNQ